MFKKFLEKIRSGDNNQKKQWLIILSGASMIIVIIIWLYYMSSFVFKSPGEETQEMQTDFWETFKTGLGVTGENIASSTTTGVSEIISKIKDATGK